MYAHQTRRTTGRLLAALAMAVSASAGGAQDAVTTLQSWRVARFGDREGLRSPIVTSLAESNSGRIWSGTASGVAWFDGWRWVPARTTPDLLTRTAARLRPMQGDSMLVVMHNLLFVGDTAGFVQREVRVGGKQEQVRDAAWSRDGLYLLVAYDQVRDSLRLMRWRGDSAELVDPPAPLRGADVPALFPAPDGDLWLNTSAGLYRRREGRWRLVLPSTGGNVRVPVLVETRDGRVLASVVGGAGSGVYTWRGDERPRRDASEGDDEMVGGAEDRNGGLLAVHRGGYVRRWANGRWAPYGGRVAPPTDTRTVLRDRVGDLWIGTGLGLFLFRESSQLWGGIPHGFPSLRDRVHALVREPDGTLWAATADGIDVFRPDGIIRHIREAAGIPLRTVTTVARDSAGNIWVGSGSDLSGALRWDGRRWRHFGAADGLGAEHVHRIVVTARGAIWFLGIGGGAFDADSGPGAFVLDSGRFRSLGTDDGLPSGRVYDFAEAPDGTQWFATARGVSRRRNGTWTHWTERRGRAGTMNFSKTPIRVFTLALDRDGRPWFGDAHGQFPYGLGTVEADTLRFYGPADGLLSNQVQSVQVGPDGAIWAGTMNGLSAFRDGEWFNFGTDRGLGFPQIWPLLVGDSTVTIGTLGGGVRELLLSAAVLPPPQVTIPPVTVGTELVNVSWHPLAWRGALASAQIETRTRFDGGPWGPWSTARTAITPLRGGMHTFEVQAKGLYGPIDGPIARAEFHVPGPLVTRPAFLIPVATLALIIIGLAVTGARRQRRDADVLRESERRFRALAASTSEGIAIAVSGRIVDANEQLHRMVGVPEGALRGRALADVLGVDEGAAGDEVRAAAIARGDGTRFPAEVRVRAVPYFGMEARVAAVQDLSERDAADRALRASEERFETIFRKSPTAILLTSWPDGRLVDVSDGFEATTGYARADLVGRTPVELGLHQDPEEQARIDAVLARSGRAQGVELSLRRNGGGVRTLLGTFVRLDLDGRPHVLGALTDISDRRTLEAQLLQSQKMEAVGRLAGGVAHDFNNLLTVILGHTDMLRSSVADPDALADVQDIHAAAQRAADLTRQLLTFARKQRISPRIVALGALVERTQRMLARLLGERIAIEARIASDLPQVLVDAGQIEQVLVNLAVNARDAMPQGGRLTIEATPVDLDEAYARDHAHVTAGRFAMIALSDTGMGIPDDVLPRIFEPFFTTKDVGQGTGLGLAICYGIVREAGGHIAVYSEVGRGTTVRVYLPARPQLDEDEPGSGPTPAAAVTGGNEPVLVVEDEPLVRSLVERALRSLGYRVSTAGSLQEALDVAAAMTPPPRLLVTDVVLPGAGGPEIARTLRSRIPELAVLYISGYTERGSSQTISLDAPLLSKPFTTAELGTAVRRVLERPPGA